MSYVPPLVRVNYIICSSTALVRVNCVIYPSTSESLVSLDTGGLRVGENNRVEIHLQVRWVWGQGEMEGRKKCRKNGRIFFL